MKRAALFLIIIASLLPMSGCFLTTQQGQAMDTKMAKLEARVAEAEKAANQTKETVDYNVGKMADAQVYFENMREEFESMKGSLDEVKYAKNRNTKEYENLRAYLDERFSKIDKRLVELEKKAGIKSADSVAEPIPNTLEGVPVAKKSEGDAFQEALLDFKKQKYDNSRKLFLAFQKQFPLSQKNADAQFYIAESLFLQKNYTEAILSYDELTSKYSKSQYVPQAILNQAISFEQMGQKFDAKLFYEKVISQYPNSEEAKIAKKKLSLLKK